MKLISRTLSLLLLVTAFLLTSISVDAKGLFNCKCSDKDKAAVEQCTCKKDCDGKNCNCKCHKTCNCQGKCGDKNCTCKKDCDGKNCNCKCHKTCNCQGKCGDKNCTCKKDCDGKNCNCKCHKTCNCQGKCGDKNCTCKKDCDGKNCNCKCHKTCNCQGKCGDKNCTCKKDCDGKNCNCKCHKTCNCQGKCGDKNCTCKDKKKESLVQQTFERPWGTYTVIAEGDGYLIKTITVKPDQKLSVQRHNHRGEHWFVLEGTAKVIKGDKEVVLKEGEAIDIEVKEIHSLQNPYKTTLTIMEVQKGDIIDENDIERLSDIYGRK